MGFSFRRGFHCLFGRARRLSGKTRCSVCLKYYKLTALRTLPQCTHTYCRLCLRRTFSRPITEPDCVIPPRCCGAAITLTIAGDFLDGGDGDGQTELKEQYLGVLENRTNDPVFCANGCMRERREGEEEGPVAGKRRVFILPEDIKEEEDLAMCRSCRKGTCTLCKKPAPHKGGAQACEVKGEEEKEEIRYMRLSGRSGWRCCDSCGMMVSRDVGCSHVVCRCGNDVWLAF